MANETKRKPDVHDPATWPMALLPLVRGGGVFGELGFLMPGQPGSVHRGNACELDAAGIAAAPKLVYPTWADAAADDWVIN